MNWRGRKCLSISISPLSPFPHSPSIPSTFPHFLPISSKSGYRLGTPAPAQPNPRNVSTYSSEILSTSSPESYISTLAATQVAAYFSKSNAKCLLFIQKYDFFLQKILAVGLKIYIIFEDFLSLA